MLGGEDEADIQEEEEEEAVENENDQKQKSKGEKTQNGKGRKKKKGAMGETKALIVMKMNRSMLTNDDMLSLLAGAYTKRLHSLAQERVDAVKREKTGKEEINYELPSCTAQVMDELREVNEAYQYFLKRYKDNSEKVAMKHEQMKTKPRASSASTSVDETTRNSGVKEDTPSRNITSANISGRGGGKPEKRVKEEVTTSGKKKKKGQKWKTMGEDMRMLVKVQRKLETIAVEPTVVESRTSPPAQTPRKSALYKFHVRKHRKK